jgi:hypothetical protein
MDELLPFARCSLLVSGQNNDDGPEGDDAGQTGLLALFFFAKACC